MGTQLQEKAMLARLNISQWTARKYDKKISDEVADRHADQTADKNDVGRYNKILIAQAAVKKIAEVVNEARTFHYVNTLPWHDDGARLLPAKNYPAYMKRMRELHSEFDARVREFVDSYPALMDEARKRLDSMYNEADYPRAAEVISRYSYNVAFDPIPTGTDFRVTLTGGEIDRIAAEVNGRLQQAQEAAMKDLWQRLHAVVSKMADRMADADAKFKNSLVGNIVELVDLLPALNIADDPELEAMRRRVEKTLCQYDPKELRENKNNRDAAAKDAKTILDAMSGYMGGGK